MNPQFSRVNNYQLRRDRLWLEKIMFTKLVRMSLIICAILVSLAISSKDAYATFDLTSWQYSRSIETMVTSGIVKAFLPTNISWVGSDFSDVRVVDEQGGEVPFMFTRNITSSIPTVATRLLDVSTQNDNSTRFIADTGQSGIVRTNIGITTSAPNFRRQVSVYASNSLIALDDSRWSLVTNNGYIFKFTDPNTSYVSGKDFVDFSANTSRYFKIVISSGSEGTVGVIGASVQGSVFVNTQTYSKQLPIIVFNNLKKKTTEVTIDLSDGYLTNSVTLYPTDLNYSRRVVIEVANDLNLDLPWKYIGEGSISHISTSVFQGSSNRINFSEQRSRYIRISIVNDDNPPLFLAPKSLIEGSILAIIFEVRPSKNYSLYYGNSQARQPQYDISRISSYIEEKSLPLANISAEIENPSYVPPKGPIVPYTESHKGLLNGILVLVVIVIGGGILIYLRLYIKKNHNQKTW